MLTIFLVETWVEVEVDVGAEVGVGIGASAGVGVGADVGVDVGVLALVLLNPLSRYPSFFFFSFHQNPLFFFSEFPPSPSPTNHSSPKPHFLSPQTIRHIPKRNEKKS